MARDMKNVVELSAGKFDAVRVLRDALAEAERGNLTEVILICSDRNLEDRDTPYVFWPTWSEMKKEEILWMTKWFTRFIDNRYFPADSDDD